MRLFIKVENGQAVGHPILEENFRQAFPDVDLDNLPQEFSLFERVEQPEIKPYEIYLGSTYEKFGDVFKDVHNFKNMTSRQKTEKINKTKEIWANGPAYASWIFNEETCSFQPPIPHPEGKPPCMWDEDNLCWVEINNQE